MKDRFEVIHKEIHSAGPEKSTLPECFDPPF